MKKFKDIEEVDEYFDEMDYNGFWYAVSPYNVVAFTKEHCDEMIAADDGNKETVFEVIKMYARIEIMMRQNLKRRMPTPWVQLVASN